MMDTHTKLSVPDRPLHHNQITWADGRIFLPDLTNFGDQQLTNILYRWLVPRDLGDVAR